MDTNSLVPRAQNRPCQRSKRNLGSQSDTIDLSIPQSLNPVSKIFAQSSALSDSFLGRIMTALLNLSVTVSAQLNTLSVGNPRMKLIAIV